MRKIKCREFIDGRQSAFLGERNILHSTLVANEVVDKRGGRRESVCYLKLTTKKHVIQYVGVSFFI